MAAPVLLQVGSVLRRTVALLTFAALPLIAIGCSRSAARDGAEASAPMDGSPTEAAADGPPASEASPDTPIDAVDARVEETSPLDSDVDGGAAEAGIDGADVASDGGSHEVPDAVDEMAPDGPTDICSGATGLTLIYYRDPTLSSVPPGSQVVRENGMSFLFMDGGCHYWVFGASSSELEETRSGALSAADAAALAADLSYAEWPSLAGRYRPSSVLFDGAWDVLNNGSQSVACVAQCSWDEAPPQLKSIYDKATAWLRRLHEMGSPLDTWMRVASVDLTSAFPTWAYKVAPWSLTVPVTSLELPYNGPILRGTSFRVDGSDAIALRSLRKAQAAEAYNPAFVGTFIPVRSTDGRLFGVYARDGLPFEDARGLVSIPPY